MGKLSKRIEQAIRRRAKVVRPQAEEQIKLIVSDRERDVFTRTHATVLLGAGVDAGSDCPTGLGDR